MRSGSGVGGSPSGGLLVDARPASSPGSSGRPSVPPCGDDAELSDHRTAEPSKLLRAQDGLNCRDGGVNAHSSLSSESLVSLSEPKHALPRCEAMRSGRGDRGSPSEALLEDARQVSTPGSSGGRRCCERDCDSIGLTGKGHRGRNCNEGGVNEEVSLPSTLDAVAAASFNNE